MAQVKVLLFGLGRGALGKTQRIEPIGEATTVEDMWLRLRSHNPEDVPITVTDPTALLVLVNGQPIEYLEGWKTTLADNDQVTYLRRTVGG